MNSISTYNKAKYFSEPFRITLFQRRHPVRQARRKWGARGALVFSRTVNPYISSRGDRLCPPQYYEPPRIFRPCDGPAFREKEISKALEYKVGPNASS